MVADAVFPLGLALSGGGSRAMAFHRGTVRALVELGVADAVDVVSTVSGGSVFGAGWMCALADGRTTTRFLDDLAPILRRGFVLPALLSPRVLQVLLPWRNRTHRLAETFDTLLTGGRKLPALPERPYLRMSVTVLNHAAPGRFARDGFSCRDVGHRAANDDSYPATDVGVSVGFAAAASAAFPFGLPPLTLPARKLPPFEGALLGHRNLVMTDGGVLENLGVQLLLRSQRRSTANLIVSDAGTAQVPWQPSLLERLKATGIFALSLDTLAQLLLVMSEKQNKSMREISTYEAAIADLRPTRPVLWLARVNQNLGSFLRGISATRRAAIAGAGRPIPDENASPELVARFLAEHGVDLGEAKRRYEAMGGDARAAEANRVPTQFFGLPADTLDLLEQHAAWQVHACAAVYGNVL